MLHVWYIYLHLGDFLAANVETYFSTMEHTEVSKNRGTLSHHPFSDGIFAYKPFILGDPYMETSIWQRSAGCSFPASGSETLKPRFNGKSFVIADSGVSTTEPRKTSCEKRCHIRMMFAVFVGW